MIYDDFSRQVLLTVTGGIFACFALWAAFRPKSLATSLGYTLASKNAIGIGSTQPLNSDCIEPTNIAVVQCMG